jgi:hypothetical protein
LLKTVLAVTAFLNIMNAVEAAPSCENFKAAVVEAAGQYRSPVPKFPGHKLILLTPR